MVALSVFFPSEALSPTEAFHAIDHGTVALLFGMMVIGAGIADSGMLAFVVGWLAARKLSPGGMLHVITIGSGVLSALLLNDTICLLATPIVVALIERRGLPRVPYLFAIAMGSNAGSAITLAGNPQNVLIAKLSGITYVDYVLRAGPAAFAGLVVTSLVLRWMFKTELASAREPSAVSAAEHGFTAPPRLAKRPLFVLSIVVIAFFAGADLAWTSLVGAALIMLLRGRDAEPLFSSVSWTVLVFFASLFVLVAGITKSGVAPDAIEGLISFAGHGTAGLAMFVGALVIGCQLISNVPFILLAEPMVRGFDDPTFAWTLVAIVSTFAGNLTLLGSVANILVLESAGAEKEIGFRKYLRVGLPVTAASLAVAILVLWATRGALG